MPKMGNGSKRGRSSSCDGLQTNRRQLERIRADTVHCADTTLSEDIGGRPASVFRQSTQTGVTENEELKRRMKTSVVRTPAVHLSLRLRKPELRCRTVKRIREHYVYYQMVRGPKVETRFSQFQLAEPTCSASPALEIFL